MQEFGKQHQHVIRDAEGLDCSPEFRQSNFGRTSYTDQWNRKKPCYYMTRDGFMFLVMGYRGKKAAAIKGRFNQMEKFIGDVVTAQFRAVELSQRAEAQATVFQHNSQH